MIWYPMGPGGNQLGLLSRTLREHDLERRDLGLKPGEPYAEERAAKAKRKTVRKRKRVKTPAGG